MIFDLIIAMPTWELIAIYFIVLFFGAIINRVLHRDRGPHCNRQKEFLLLLIIWPFTIIPCLIIILFYTAGWASGKFFDMIIDL